MNHDTVIMLSLIVDFLNYWGLTEKQTTPLRCADYRTVWDCGVWLDLTNPVIGHPPVMGGEELK